MAASLSRLQARHWILVGLGAVAAAAARGRSMGFGVAVGGTVIGVSVGLYVLGLDLVVRKGRPRLAIGVLSVKLLALLGLGWFAFASGQLGPDPIGFAVGVSCFPAAAVWEAMRARGS